MNPPRISVLMPVYNGGNYLRPAIESILAQTCRDFEFLIIDDGSTDASREICRGYGDERIRCEENGRNLGLIATLNRGLDLARGQYIARMDCDDISFPERFSRQLDFMDRHPEIGVCGTWYERCSDHGMTLMKPTAEDRLIRFFLIFDTVFAHNTIFLRRDFIEAHRLRYDPDFKYAEDYEFWTRCSRYTRFANIPEALLRYHYHPENTSSRFREEQIRTADRVRCAYLTELGLSPTARECKLHTDLIQFRRFGDMNDLRAAGEWLMRLASAAGKTLDIPESIILRELGRYWYGACAGQADRGLEAWRLFNAYPLGRKADRTWRAKLLARSLLRREI